MASNTIPVRLMIIVVVTVLTRSLCVTAQPQPHHDLSFEALSPTWDEGFPLGNGMLGCLVWQKENKLRFSLDRADLWDLRPMKGLDRPEFRYSWIVNQVARKDYAVVQKYFDTPYETEPAPTKIPGGALEFDVQSWGPVVSARLSVKDAVTEVRWQNGIILKTFVHATLPAGWFRFENITADISLDLVPPRYEGPVISAGGSVDGDDLSRLGYTQGEVTRKNNSLTYRQQGWGGFYYEISVQWKRHSDSTLTGVWSISSHYPDGEKSAAASEATQHGVRRGFKGDLAGHLLWWKNFWSKSSIHIPDSILEKQWYLEQYKFGSASRRGAPPISLQAVWTADNGRIPPWKGDYHHDLNTQLSYWPSYSANHLEEALAYIDHLEKNKANYKRYTKLFFEKEGIAVPGVTTLEGTEMGGWTQYSLSPTVSAWLGHHYYLQWRYTMDRKFLKERAYPWIRDVAEFLDQIMVRDKNGLRKLPLGSSPEIHNNDIKAWFEEPTNYDVALIRFTFSAAAELAAEMNLQDDAIRWEHIFKELPDHVVTPANELMFSPSLPYRESHRHFSHLMAIHPLSLLRWEDGERSQSIISNSLTLLDKIGPDWWCGYSYSWLGNLKARAKDGPGAARALKTFATAFCLKNSFHVNGDQTKSGLSKFTYRPFTLEGNFAFAAGIQEMLLQSYAGFIELMPAVPAEWHDVSFENLRTEGAFLVSAKRRSGHITELNVIAETGGKTLIRNPFIKWNIQTTGKATVKELEGFLEISCSKGDKITVTVAP